MTEPTLSVIIPTLNEANTLPGLLLQLGRQQHITLEVIVADGGSQDNTRMTHQMQNARWISAPRGRGAQLHAGGMVATGRELLFLHADSTLTAINQLALAVTALAQMRQHCGHDRVAGHFSLHFQDAAPALARPLRFHAAKSALNRKGCINGDQGFLLGRRFYQELGGFNPQLAFMEDQDLAARIHQAGVWITLPGILNTSARRFQREGYGRRTLLNALIMTCHHTGWQAFLQQAPDLYRQQDHTRPLQLAPFFRLLVHLNRMDGIQVAWQRWRAIGRYARQETWQIFFMLDLLLALPAPMAQKAACPCLAFHDRFWKPCTRFPLFDLLAMGLVWLWLQSARIWYTLREEYFHVS
ncbi:MAG: TIGR04283 family arsenosugar biosynthesis glycosyltransferase [Magnetococcus sp. DMHC-1]|nr:TIGR04283 family arsenosugar biosynthesis glycosyltransferase [Magnetococcales bacterium]